VSDQEIRNLIFRYAECMDRGDFAAVGALFAHAWYSAGDGPRLRGADAVTETLRRLVIVYEDGTPRTHHLTTNVQLDVDGSAGTARARSYFSVIQGASGGILQPVVAGRYHDAFERSEGTWRFCERRVIVDLVGDVRRHLRGNPLAPRPAP
jgi:3-phenylpropionate/cinnamic acid dioxygenase small subunit